jgi:hypothetical protein
MVYKNGLYYVCYVRNTGIPWFTSLIHSSKTARKAKTRKMKISFPLLPTGTTIGLQEEGACISENWLIN